MFRLIGLISLCLLAIEATAQVSSVRLLVHVPVTTGDRNVYVAGSFNHWQAGDSLYKMHRLNDSIFSIVLPVYRNLRYQYKYTLGNWNSVEIASNDSNTTNRTFTSVKKQMKIRDRVLKWQQPASAAGVPSPQMIKINAMKDSVLAGLQPKLEEMKLLLADYITNLLQEKPSEEADQKITSEITRHFAEAYGRINDLFHQIFASLTTQQRQKILIAINDPKSKGDIINALGSALAEVTKENPN